MITDEQLNTLAIAFGVIMVTLIVVYHAIFSSTRQTAVKEA
ncbi:LAFA_0F15357g1_1 [Lachancea sp. 'fantastica']|nr:LAFA_0F15357g1_1 [Lachancea sp. 'fantastica']